MIISRDEMRDRLGSILSKLTGQQNRQRLTAH